MDNKKDFGVLYGQKTTEDALLIYSSYEDSKASPHTGDFIVLTERHGNGQKFLARVEAEIYDEDPIFRSQDKTLVAVHYARIAKRDLSVRDKQKMFSYTYKVKILGVFEGDGDNFTTAVRKLPVVSYHARYLSDQEFSNILNRTNEKGVNIGNLCIGEEVKFKEQSIQFDISKLREKRTMIFAQSGFGKTNLMKIMLYHMIKDNEYGKLIFDLNGEYCFSSNNTVGLADIDKKEIRDNLVIFTDKNTHGKHSNVRINMIKHLTVRDILDFGTGFSEVMKAFLLHLDTENASDFVKNMELYAKNSEELHKKYPDFFSKKKDGTPDASAKRTIMAIRKRVLHVMRGLHQEDSKMLDDIHKALKEGKTVIVDLSLRDNDGAKIVSTILVREIFENNKTHFTEEKTNEVIDCVICVEEAQNVISEEFVKSNANPFVRVAKEGRKFKMGMIAITQRPSAIAEEIRSQAENFFAFYMGNSDDIKALVRSNINYDGVISQFLQTETIRGNLYMVSADQSFALPVRVIKFEDMIPPKKNQ